jgi:hypothetical protein
MLKLSMKRRTPCHGNYAISLDTSKLLKLSMSRKKKSFAMVTEDVKMALPAGEHAGAQWSAGTAEYLEWGSGGSTSMYGTAAGRVFSVVGRCSAA